ncbi:hypothetical protein ACFT5B_03140 [Luteimicrobium sp. NPDC057192]|uniref:hypothetical protein n=1 Tax=Luteimicrobium sp. NPDC057192 TaxID=3346042 RepID=UPI00363E3E08
MSPRQPLSRHALAPVLTSTLVLVLVSGCGATASAPTTTTAASPTTAAPSPTGSSTTFTAPPSPVPGFSPAASGPDDTLTCDDLATWALAGGWEFGDDDALQVRTLTNAHPVLDDQRTAPTPPKGETTVVLACDYDAGFTSGRTTFLELRLVLHHDGYLYLR